jgi:hypothetical protein
MKCFIVDMRWNGAKSLRRESPAFGSAIGTSYFVLANINNP